MNDSVALRSPCIPLFLHCIDILGALGFLRVLFSWSFRSIFEELDLGIQWSGRRGRVGGVNGTRKVQCQGAMASAGFKDLYRRLVCLGGRGIRVKVEEGDDQIGVVGVDLLA